MKKLSKMPATPFQTYFEWFGLSAEQRSWTIRVSDEATAGDTHEVPGESPENRRSPAGEGCFPPSGDRSMLQDARASEGRRGQSRRRSRGPQGPGLEAAGDPGSPWRPPSAQGAGLAPRLQSPSSRPMSRSSTRTSGSGVQAVWASSRRAGAMPSRGSRSRSMS